MMIRMRRLIVVLGLTVIVLAASGRASPSQGIGANVVEPYAPGSVLMGGIHVEPPSGVDISQAIDASEAVTRAAEAGAFAGTLKPLSSQLALVTNDDYGPVGAAGVVLKLIDHRLAWLIRFAAEEQPVYGGMRADGRRMNAGVDPATELNVLVDARTGEILQMFSFQ